MRKKFRILLILIQILTYLNLSRAFSQNDLDTASAADFELEANQWTLSNAVCPSCSKVFTIPANDCGIPQEKILGGPNILGPKGSNANGQYFERQLSGLTMNGYEKGIQFDLWIFSKETLSSLVSNWLYITVSGGSTVLSLSIEFIESCEIDYSDSDGVVIKAFYKYRYQIWVSLTTSSTALRVIQKFASPTTLDSIGIRNVKIFMLDSPGYYPSWPANFPCPPPKYWDGSSTTCSDCSTDCTACTGPLVEDCFACGSYWYKNNNTCSMKSCSGTFVQVKEGGYLYCEKRCATGYYWSSGPVYCKDDCNSPLQPAIDQNGYDVCVNPCAGKGFLYPDGSCSTCSSAQFSTKESIFCVSPCESTTKLSFLNKTCTSTCESPRSEIPTRGILICQSPCPTQYLYANASCSSNCKAPLVKIEEESDIKLCVNPCLDPVNEFLYLDGTCNFECPSPLLSRSEPGVRYCWNPCNTTSLLPYLYPNSTCKAACKSPLKSRNESGISFCENPCSDPVKEFLYLDGTCKSECPSPLLSRSEPGAKYCWNPCNTSSLLPYLYPNSICKSDCPSPFIKKEILDIKLCIDSCPNPANQYLYPDGTCKSNCPSPLINKEDSGLKLCINPCPDPVNQYVYPNSTCKSICDSPFSVTSDAFAKYCNFPCTGSNPFLYFDGVCRSTCPSRFVLRAIYGIMRYCDNPCAELINQYLYPDGTCEPSCISPLVSLTQYGIQFCNSPCSASPYLYPNLICKADCLSPLVKRTESGIQYCSNPCDLSTEYLFDNGDCSSQCNLPLEIKIDAGFVQYCQNPCYANDTFIYPNNSCIKSCPEPLYQKTQNGVKYCLSPCPDVSNYLYPDNSCSNQCPYPLSSRTDSVAKYCFSPCVGSDFLFKNGSCFPACNAPYIKFQSSKINQCSPPCEDPQYFDETSQTCKSACVSPYESKLVNGVRICLLTDQLAPKEAEKTKSTVSMIVSQGQATQVGLKATSSFNSANPALALLAAQASMLFYIRYIDLDYTAKLKLFFLLQDASPFSFTLGIDMPEALEEKLRDRELPKVFEEYDLHSNFLYNSWDMLSSLGLALLLILLMTVIKMFTRRWRKIDRIVGGVLAILKWNIPLTVVCGGFGDIYFYASFQLQSSDFDSIFDVLCLILSIVMMFLGVGILAMTVKIVKDLLKKSQQEEEKEGKWQNFELLYESYERKSFFSFGYMALFLVRTIIFNLIIANLYRYPLVQSILINILTILMFGYLVVKRPLKSVLELVQLFLNEIFLIIVNVCVLIIAIMDKAHIKGKDLRHGICETVIKVIMIFSSSALAFVALQILISLYFFYRLLKRLKSEGKLNPSGILNAWLGREESRDTKKLEDQEEKTGPMINLSRRRYKKANRNMGQLNSQTQEKTPLPQLEITKKDTTNQLHSEIFDNSLISEAPMLNIVPRTRPGSGENLKDNSLFEISQLIMESNNENSRVITIDPLDFVGNKKKNTSLAHMVHEEQERRNYLRRFGIVNFREKSWQNQGK